MVDVGVLSIKDSGGTYRAITINNLVHERTLGKQFDALKVHTKNYEYSSGVWLYEMLGANRDIKWVVDGTTYFEGKIISRGSIGSDGSITISAIGKGADVADAKVTISLSSTTNVGVMTQALSGTGYTLNTAGSTSSILAYDYSDTRGKVFREMQDNYGWALYFEADDNVYYEPLGYYSSGESINTASDNARIVKWEKDIIRGVVVNNVEVVGTKNGTKYTGTDSDATSISNHGERFKRIVADYLNSDAEAVAVATASLQPNAGEGGVVEVYWYKDNLVNETIEIIDDQRAINDDFIVVKQVNYFPERKTQLHVGYVAEEGQFLTNQTELGLRRERQRLLTNSSVDVGGQTIDDETELDDNTISGGIDTENITLTGGVDNEDITLTGSVLEVETDEGYSAGTYDESVYGDIENASWTNCNTSYTTSNSYDYLFHMVMVNFFFAWITVNQGYEGTDVYVRLKNEDTGETYPSSGGFQLLEQVYMDVDDVTTPMTTQISVGATIYAPENWRNDTLRLQYYLDFDESDATCLRADMFYVYTGAHSHTHDDDKDAPTHDHTDDIDDTPHDHTEDFAGDDHDHDINVSTDSKNVNVVTEEKVDR